jgi:hypothetical protein
MTQGSFEVICVNSLMLVDAQNRLMLTPDMEHLMDATTVKTMPLGFFMAEVFDLGIQVSPLRLSDAEIALFNALLVMNPDRGDLQDRDHVDELHATLLHVLYKHLRYVHFCWHSCPRARSAAHRILFRHSHCLSSEKSQLHNK